MNAANLKCDGFQTALNSNYTFIVHSRTVHLDIVKVSYLPTDAQQSFLKNINIYIKTAPNIFRFNYYHQGAYYLSLLRLLFLK
jgi:hypothetical protein